MEAEWKVSNPKTVLLEESDEQRGKRENRVGSRSTEFANDIKSRVFEGVRMRHTWEQSKTSYLEMALCSHPVSQSDMAGFCVKTKPFLKRLICWRKRPVRGLFKDVSTMSDINLVRTASRK